MLSTGGALASAISSWRIISSMKVSPRPPYSLGHVRPDEARLVHLAAATRGGSRRPRAAARRTPSRIRLAQSCGQVLGEPGRGLRPGTTVCSGVSVKSIHPPSRWVASRLDGVTERRFIAMIRAALEKVSRAQQRVFLRTLRYTAAAMTPARDLAAASADPHRDPLPLRPQSRRPGHHPLLLEPAPRGSARLAARADEGRRASSTWVDEAGNTFGRLGERRARP